MYDHALSISPGDPQIIGEKAGTYLSEGNLDAADRVLAGVPGTPETAAYDRRLQLLIYRRQFDQAIGILEQELQKGDITGARALASTRGWIARLRAQAIGRDVARPLLLQAREELRVLQQDSTAVRRIDPSLLQVDAWLGDRREVEASAEALLEEAQKDPDVWAARAMDGAVARAFGILGDADRAIPLLTRALSQQYTRPLTPAILRLDPIWDPIRNDPRFQKLCKEKKP